MPLRASTICLSIAVLANASLSAAIARQPESPPASEHIRFPAGITGQSRLGASVIEQSRLDAGSPEQNRVSAGRSEPNRLSGGGPEQNRPSTARTEPIRLGADLKAYLVSPLHWQRAEWLELGGTLAAVSLAYQYDERVRAHFDTAIVSTSKHDDRDLHDALPAAGIVAGTWLYARLGSGDANQTETFAMLESAGLAAGTAYVLKLAAGRERPFQSADRGRWHASGESFPSLHVTAAFAIGTVLAESGSGDLRWLRRVFGYGIALGTAYERLDHGDHWLSDTVAGAALGLAAAHFVLQRRDGHETGTRFSLLPRARGFELRFAVALQP